jgi:hypothetical protein
MDPMRTLLLFVLTASCVLLSQGRSFAQGASPQLEIQSSPETSIVTAPPGQVSPPGYLTSPTYELEEAERRSRVVRNALIGTSVGFAVGVILTGAAISQCDSIQSFDGSDDWTCNNAGDVLTALGGTFAGLGAIGMITTGIMLGVRNKQKRDIERDMRRRYGSGLRWDPSSGRFVF